MPTEPPTTKRLRPARRPVPTYFRPWGLWRATVALPDGRRQNVSAPTREEVEALIDALLSSTPTSEGDGS